MFSLRWQALLTIWRKGKKCSDENWVPVPKGCLGTQWNDCNFLTVLIPQYGSRDVTVCSEATRVLRCSLGRLAAKGLVHKVDHGLFECEWLKFCFCLPWQVISGLHAFARKVSKLVTTRLRRRLFYGVCAFSHKESGTQWTNCKESGTQLTNWEIVSGNVKACTRRNSYFVFWLAR